MDYLKLSLVILLSFEFLCLASSNPITSLFGRSDDKAEAEDKTPLSISSTAKSGVDVTTTSGPSSSCGGLKGFLHICDKTETTETPKNVKTRSVPEESDSDSDSDESESNEDKNPADVTVTAASNDKEPTEGKIAKRQAEDSDDSENSETPESENTPVAPEIPIPEDLPLGLKKRQVDESENSSGSESDEESKRQRRDCRDGPEDSWKDCKK